MGRISLERVFFLVLAHVDHVIRDSKTERDELEPVSCRGDVLDVDAYSSGCGLLAGSWRDSIWGPVFLMV